MGWEKFVEIWDSKSKTGINIPGEKLLEEYGVYDTSVYSTEKCSCFIAREKEKSLIVTGGSSFDEFEGEVTKVSGRIVKKCPLSIFNSKVIREIFSFANPVSSGGNPVSIGLGDRLGSASPGHLKLLKGKNVFPVLAQQSIRELNLTDRTYDDVLASAVWAVLQEGYREGYGADGDHLKTTEEVEMALESGFTMITLDCSGYIDNSIEGLIDEKLYNRYKQLDTKDIEYWEGKYLDKNFSIGSNNIYINKKELAATVLIYAAALEFAEAIYKNIISGYKRSVDFEISIDETLTPTSIKAHYIIASEFSDRGVVIQNMAPRFCGDFQKGIDYRGNIEQFEDEFEIHNAIAEQFGYRISIHSGSDKFSVFPIIGEKTKGRFHLKTAGTNWLEAMKVIALEDVSLFRRMYRHAVKRLPDAKAFYHISTEADMVPDISEFADGNLVGLLDIEESRQVLHITYGYLLRDKDKTGQYLFRKEFFDTLYKHENTYYKCLENHIGRHLDTLGI